nr:signal peptidase I [Suttonella ornithocola]
MRLIEAQQNGVKKRLRTTLLSANTKLNTRKPLDAKELYWATHPVYPKEKFIEFFGGMFWILFIIWIVRSFLWEPFQIPSASMEPTLQKGDFILVDKYRYGLRLPISHTKILPLGTVKRGDVAVFRYPKNPKIAYIKRIIALPGDEVIIKDGTFVINGHPLMLTSLNQPRFGHEDKSQKYDVYKENIDGKEHLTQFTQNSAYRVNAALAQLNRQPFQLPEGVAFIVPENEYLAIGDNRDASADSRFWGFVPDANLVGKATRIWMNSDCILLRGQCNRIGKKIE